MADEKKEAPPVDYDQVKTIGGTPIGEHLELKSNGQQKDYVVLTEEERAKGFVRPVRRSYIHVGRPAPKNLRDLTPEEAERYKDDYGYVKFEEYPPSENPKTGRFWTQDELNRLGGCGEVTTMGQALAETYARAPDFYGGTFCSTCRKHYPVGANGEFVWLDNPDQRVGT